MVVSLIKRYSVAAGTATAGGDILDGFECIFLRDGNTDDCHSDCSNCGYYGDCSICANYDVCDFNSHDTMCSDYNRG